MDEHYSEMDKTLEGLASLETPPGQEEEEDEIEGEGEEMEGVGRVSVLSRARQSVRECMELLQKGQGEQHTAGNTHKNNGAESGMAFTSLLCCLYLDRFGTNCVGLSK